MPFGIEGAVESAVKSVLSFIAEKLYGMMNMLISDLLVPLITSSPMPRSDADMPMLKYPFEPGSGECGATYSSAAKVAECNMWSELYHNVYMQDVMYLAVVLFVISFSVTWTARSFGVFGDKALEGDGLRDGGDYIDRFVYAFLGILLWWPVGTGVLFFSNIFTDVLVGCTGASCEVFTSIEPSSAVGGAAIAALVLYTVGNVAMLGVVLFWVARYLILVVFMAIMPIMFSLWTLSVGPLDTISDTASEFMDFFLLLSFAPIPAGLILMMGDAIGMIAKSFPGAGQFIVQSIVFVTFPLLAGVVPIILFQQESNLSQAGMVGAAMDNQLGKVTSDSLSDYYGSGQNLGIEEDYGRARKGASGAYAAYNQGNAVEWDEEEGEWVESDDPAASSNIMNRVGLGARKTETAGMFAHDMARSEGAREAVKENLSDAHEDVKKNGGYRSFLYDQAQQRSSTVSAFDTVSQAAMGASKRPTNIWEGDEEMRYNTWRSGEEVHEAMSDFEARARRSKETTPDGDVMIEQRAEDGSRVEFDNLDDVWQLQQAGQLAQESDDLDDVVGYNSRTKINRDVLDEKFDEDELEDTEEVANAIRNGSPNEIVEAVNGQVLEENKIDTEEAKELRDESTVRMSRSVTEQAVDESVSAELEDTSKVAEAIAYGDEKDVRKAVNTQVEEHEEISKSDAESLILAAEDAANRSGLDEQSAEEYEELREFMAAMQNTEATDVDDPALRRALQEFEDTEAASQYASQFTDGLDANDVTDILGGDDLDNDTAQKLAEDAQDSVETVYTTMLQEMVEGIDGPDDIADDAEMEEVVTENLGSEYVEKAQEMVNETTLENTDLFSLVGGQTEEQMAQAVETQFEGYTQAVVEELTEALHTGDTESAFEALAREEAEQDDIEWNMRSMFDMDEDELNNLDTEGIAEAMAEGQNEMFKEMRKQMTDKSVEEVKEMQSQLMEETVETVADDLEKANKEVTEFIEENSNEFTPDEIMEQVEEMNADILEGKDDTAHEEVSETIENLEDTKYSSLAQDTLAMLSQLDSNEVDNPDLKTALTQFESKQQDIPADYFEGRDISEEDVADQLRELSDSDTERLANAASGDDYNLDGVFKMMNVAYNGNTKWEDQSEE